MSNLVLCFIFFNELKIFQDKTHSIFVIEVSNIRNMKMDKKNLHVADDPRSCCLKHLNNGEP